MLKDYTDCKTVAMEKSEHRPRKISVAQILAYRARSKIEGHKPYQPANFQKVPNITIPEAFVAKNDRLGNIDPIVAKIRELFNALTVDNINVIESQLKEAIRNIASNHHSADVIANEILANIVVSERNIVNYLRILNSIKEIKITCPVTKTISNTIGNCFLNACRLMITEVTKLANVEKLANLDPYDEDDIDILNSEREKFHNLILTICELYSWRKKPGYINLTANHIYAPIHRIISSHGMVMKKMQELGDPEESECYDEERYEVYSRMCSLYTEQLYTFMNKSGADFIRDPTQTSSGKLDMHVKTFRESIIPTIKQNWLLIKCNSIDYKDSSDKPN